jgi:hypothetical protein
MARTPKISPQKLAARKATITAYATQLELRGFTRRQIAMGMFGKALELLVDELGPDEAVSEVLRAYKITALIRASLIVVASRPMSPQLTDCRRRRPLHLKHVVRFYWTAEPFEI